MVKGQPSSIAHLRCLQAWQRAPNGFDNLDRKANAVLVAATPLVGSFVGMLGNKLWSKVWGERERERPSKRSSESER